MPFEGEFAGYAPLQRIAQSEKVRNLLRRAVVAPAPGTERRTPPPIAPPSTSKMPDFVVAIDGSNAEVPIQTGYPGARVGYCTVASVLIDLQLIDRLDESRPVDPRAFRQTEQASTLDVAIPGSNVTLTNDVSARESFRHSLYDVLHDLVLDENDARPLVETYEALLKLKPIREGREPACPVDGCDAYFDVPPGITKCPCPRRRTLFSTDALRIHEGFKDLGSNMESFGEVMQVWERLFLVHLLRCFERRNLLSKVNRLAFFVDGPLAVFGHPAWISAAIKSELQRINAKVRAATGSDLLIIGIEKTGEFVEHFEFVDNTSTPGEPFFPPRGYQLLTDAYIKQRVKLSDSDKRYGKDTYFGRKLFYKTVSGARLVATIPFLTKEQDTLDTDDVSLYPRFADVCLLLDRLVSSRYPNSLVPLVTAHAHAAIPLNLGAKVLEQLAIALMRQE